MKNLVYFLMVGLTFTILQVATVEAQAPTEPPPMGDPNAAPPMDDPNAAPPMDDPNAAPPMDGEDADMPPLEDMDFENMSIEDMFPAPEDEEGEGEIPPAQ